MLGDGWEWSDRHLCQVNSDRYKIYLQGQSLWFKVAGSNTEAVRLTNHGEPEDFPVLKMMLLTHSPEAVSEIVESFVRS